MVKPDSEHLARWVSWFLVGLLVLFGVINTFRVHGKLTHRRANVDFEVYQTAAQVASAGGNVYETHHKKPILPYHYPPLLASVLRPTVGMSLPQGALLWNLLQVAVIPVIFLLLAGMLRAAGAPQASLLAAASLMGCAWFFMDNLLWAQVNVFVLLSVVAALALLFREKPLWAGALLAVGFSIKFTPILFLLLVTRFRPKGALLFVGGFAAGVLTCFLVIPALAYGPSAAFDMSRTYIDVLRNTLFGGSIVLPCWDNCANHSLLYAFHAWFGKCGALLGRLEPETILSIFKVLRMTMLAGILASALKVALRRRTCDTQLLVVQIALASVLANPVAWIHHWVMLCVALGLLGGLALADRKNLVLALAAALLAVTVVTGHQLELVHAGLISVFLYAAWAAVAGLTLLTGWRSPSGSDCPVDSTGTVHPPTPVDPWEPLDPKEPKAPPAETPGNLPHGGA